MNIWELLEILRECNCNAEVKIQGNTWVLDDGTWMCDDPVGIMGITPVETTERNHCTEVIIQKL